MGFEVKLCCATYDLIFNCVLKFSDDAVEFVMLLFRLLLTKKAPEKNNLGCVGRGVLRFWDLRYRQPRSNLGHFRDFGGVSKIEGVDII